MYKSSIENQKTSVARPPRLHKATVIRRFQLGDVITVQIAHDWQRGYGWSNYSTSKYKVEKISKKAIIGRNVDYEREMISISRSDLDECRFIVNGV